MKPLAGIAPPSAVTTAISILLCSLAAASHAQDAPAPAAAASSAASDDGLEIAHVVVTAQKRPQFAEKVPMSLSALSQDALVKQNAASIQDIARLTPGVAAISAEIFGTPSISIRGVASTAGTATTAIYIDDAAIATRSNLGPEAGGTAYPKLFDLDRVEVLRGPQGTLFGSGAEGGAIRFITPTPAMDRFGGLAHAGIAGSARGAGSVEVGAAVGGPLVADTLAFRTSLERKHDGGWIDHVDRDSGAITGRNTNGDDTTVARTAFLWRPTADLTIAPSLFYQDDFQHDRATWYEEAGTYRTYNHIPQPGRDRFTLSSLAVTYDTDALELKSITSVFDRHLRRIDDYSYVMPTAFTDGSEELPGDPGFLSVNHEATDQRVLTQEFRLSSNDDGTSRLNWVAGVYLSRSRQVHHQQIEQDSEAYAQALFGESSLDVFGESGVGPGGIYGFIEDDTLRDRSLALFGEANWKLAPHTTLTAGLRAGRNTFDFATHEDGPVAGGVTDFSGSQSDHSLLPKFAVSQDLGTSDMVYASAAKGNRVGGANPSYASVPGCGDDLAAMGIADNPRTYAPDSLWSYELGYKARLLGQRLELAASVFRVDWKNIQQSVLLPVCQFNYTTNLGNARSVGGDLQLQFRATRHLLLSGSVAYTDAHYTNTSWAAPAASAGTDAIATAGDKLPEPPLSLAFGAEFDWTPTPATKAFARVDYQHQSGFHRTGSPGTYNYDAGLYRAPATDYFSLHGGLTAGAVSYGAYVDNLMDTHTETMRTHDSPTDPDFQAMTFRPRTLGLTVDYKF
jgi:outer membrane receptor protein involved in Fe transport